MPGGILVGGELTAPEDVIDELSRAADNNEEVDLEFHFDDELFGESRGMHEDLIAYKATGRTIESINFDNGCEDPKARAGCLDLFAKLLSPGPYGRISDCWYCQSRPITLEDAAKIGSAIRSTTNGSIERFQIQNSFAAEGAFVRVLNAALDSGVQEFVATFESCDQLRDGSGCIAASNLAANTTLKSLCLFNNSDKFSAPPREAARSIAEQLSEVVRANRGLEELFIDRTMIRSEGRQILLDALRHNGTLLRLDTLEGHRAGEDPRERERNELAQREIDASLEINRVWNRYEARSALMSSSREETVSAGTYPALLRALANKPMHLFRFARSEFPQLLSSGGSGGSATLACDDGGGGGGSAKTYPRVRGSKRGAAASLLEEDSISKKAKACELGQMQSQQHGCC